MDQEQEKVDSIFDFLYADRVRLSTLLAQLSDDGVITTAKRTATHSVNNNGSLTVGVAVAKGSASIADAASEAHERQFDASWLLPLNALTVLQEANLIGSSLDGGIGKIALVKGTLAFHDLELLKSLWDSVTNWMSMTKTPHKHTKNSTHESKAVGLILKALPSSLTATLRTDAGDVWTILDEESVTFRAHLISLKHGPMMQGTWHMLGIIDALPDEPADITPQSDNLIDRLGGAIQGIREIVGRPYTSYSMTPLAIFRPCG